MAELAVADDVSADDVVLCGSLVVRSTRTGEFWDRALQRHVERSLAGLAPQG